MSKSLESLMLHQKCGRCGEQTNAPHRVVVAHRDCLLRGISAAELKYGKSRRIVHHEKGSSPAVCEVCFLDSRQIALVDVLIHPVCLQSIEPKVSPKLAKRSKGVRSRQRSDSCLRGGFSVCPSCGRSIQQSGKCGCS